MSNFIKCDVRGCLSTGRPHQRASAFEPLPAGWRTLHFVEQRVITPTGAERLGEAAVAAMVPQLGPLLDCVRSSAPTEWVSRNYHVCPLHPMPEFEEAPADSAMFPVGAEFVAPSEPPPWVAEVLAEGGKK
jgi:hypothetical protein